MGLGSSWAQIGLRLGAGLQIDFLGVTFGASRPDFGWAWELFDYLWGHLGVISFRVASKIDAAGDLDIAKTV